MQETFTISELGNEFGITTRAIRFYEDKQLLTPSRQGNRRVYSRSDRTRLKLLLRGKRLGWPLEEIRDVLNMYDQGHEGEIQQLEYTCRKVRESREQLQQQQRDIEAALQDLSNIESRCLARIDLLTDEPIAGSTKNRA
jgi:DNA-binding transcriptional MerR regulator